MKVTRVESIVLLDRYHLVRVHTDEGIDGVGEVSPMNAAVTHAMIERALARLVVGDDPFDIERIWHKMFHTPYKLMNPTNTSGSVEGLLLGVDPRLPAPARQALDESAPAAA